MTTQPMTGNTGVTPEMRPCPFPHEVKRGPFLEIDTIDFGFVRVSCSDCGCAGPFVTTNNAVRPSKAEKSKAIELWNARSASSPNHADTGLVELVIGAIAANLDISDELLIDLQACGNLEAVARASLASIPDLERMDAMREALEHIRSEAQAAKAHTNEPYYMQVVLDDIEAATKALAGDKA